MFGFSKFGFLGEVTYDRSGGEEGALMTAIWVASAVVMATPQTSPSTWLGTDDYPPSAIGDDKEGATTVALEVDEAGRASACRVSSSSGSVELDNLTCSLLVERARFNPALGQDGQAVRSTYTQRVAWRIPREELISQGFKQTYTVTPSGELSNCQIEKFHVHDEVLPCSMQMMEVVANAHLPSQLGSYKTTSIMIAMEVEDSGAVIPRRSDEDRTIISRAFVDVSADGVVTACRSDVTGSFLGQLADLCEIAVEVGSREFEPDPDGLEHTLSVTLEVSGQRR